MCLFYEGRIISNEAYNSLLMEKIHQNCKT
jgi:hypothetical protein